MRVAVLRTAFLCGLASLLPRAAPASPPPRTTLTFPVAPGEVEILEAALMADVRANCGRHCPRPVLHGEPLPGPAYADLLALGEPDAFDACLDLFNEDNGLVEWLNNPRGEPPAVVVLTTWLCRPIAARVSLAVRHEDACSPFLAGCRAEDMYASARFMRAAKAVVLLAQDLARSGERSAGLALLTDMLRFSQDVERGDGVSEVGRMFSNGTSSILILWGLLPFLQSEAATPAELGSLIADLSELLATEPAGAAVLAADRESFELMYALPALKGPGWVPPGGFDPSLLREDGTPITFDFEDRDQQARELIVNDAIFRRLEQACPPDLPVTACAAALTRIADEAKAADPALDEELDAMNCGSQLTAEVAGDRERTLEVRTACQAAFLSGYVTRPMLTSHLLTAVRLQARMRLHALTTGRCPTLADLRSPAWQAWTLDPVAGRPVDLAEEQPGLWRVCPGPGESPPQPWQIPYRFACVDEAPAD